MLVAVAVAASTGRTATPPPAASFPPATATVPSASASPSASPAASVAPTPDPSATAPTSAFRHIDATSCDPSVVPQASAAPLPSGSPSPGFALRVPVLMYHRIAPYAQAIGSRPGLVVPPEVFAAQLDALEAAGWHAITAAQLADDLAAGVTPPARTFVITIDDGWKDGYTFALPILQAHGFVATYYVIAGRINSGSFLDAWQLRALVAAGDEVGDHTVDHIGLANQPTQRLTYEIDAAAATIASATGVWPRTFAYPSGSHDLRAELAVQACATMTMAFVEGDAAYETWANRFVVPRIRVTADDKPASLLDELATVPLLPPPTTSVPRKPGRSPRPGRSANPGSSPSPS